AFSVVIGFAGWFRRRTWLAGATRNISLLRGPLNRAGLVHAARYLLAVGVTGIIGVLTGSGRPHWAMAAAAVPLAGADLPSRVHR
ncbi:hypothetical protein SB677_20975, partial [Bacillus sp. SIMBA_033]